VKHLIPTLFFFTLQSAYAQLDPGSSWTAELRTVDSMVDQVSSAQRATLIFVDHLHQRELLCGKKTGIISSGTNLQEIRLKLMSYQAIHSTPNKCGERDRILRCITDKKYYSLMSKMKSEPGLMSYLIKVHRMKKKDAYELISYFEKLDEKN